MKQVVIILKCGMLIFLTPAASNNHVATDLLYLEWSNVTLFTMY
jgi:hypothetical protein